jgi:shikimate kinase
VQQARSARALPPERIVLVGFMGSGKSTVGMELARLLGWRFRDLDLWLEKRAGCSIRDMFREQGESFFREREGDAARATVRLKRHVIAAGGGAFAFPETRAALQNGAVTVWLRCCFATLAHRVAGDPSRPLATSRETMRRLLRERIASYRLADLTVDTERVSPAELAHLIASSLRLHVRARSRSPRR